ncbi:MAG TPA: DUF4097 family beta strand repeat-containing protein [Ktedonobacterales bacterium]|jgi:hypothetical protein
MNNHEPGFADPAASYGDRRPINTDPREQPGFAFPAANLDPREQPRWQPMPAPIMARPPRQGRSPWAWMGVSVLILVIIFGGLASASVLLTHIITNSRTFTVGAQPTLRLSSNSGDIHIVSGPSQTISITARQRVFWGDNDPLPVHYQQTDANTLTVTVDERPTFSFLFSYNNGIDFDVTVPSQTSLEVHTDSGDITSTGVNGQIALTASSGDITTNGGSGQITLTTSSGDIEASNINGQMRLTTSSGDITAANANARGNSTFQTSSGDISFNGSLEPDGSYGFQASSGDIDLTLPNDAAFQVQATTDSGDISSDFSGVNVFPGSSGAVANGSVGSAPYARITIQASSGDIYLHKA